MDLSDNIYGNVYPCQRNKDDIYANQETITSQISTEQTKKNEETPGAGTTERKYYRIIVVLLGLLCGVLLAIIIWMVSKQSAETEQLQNNVDQLQSINNNLTQEIDKQIVVKNNLTQENDYCQARNTDLQRQKNDLIEKARNLTAEKEKLSNICRSPLWKCFGSSLYYISTIPKSWSDSKQHCINLGGHLVIIDSEEEQRFIFQLGKRAWIGLTVMENERTWKWVNGNMMSKRYWIGGEPNDHGGNEDCVEIRPDGNTPLKSWNDSVCSTTKNYICEIA